MAFMIVENERVAGGCRARNKQGVLAFQGETGHEMQSGKRMAGIA